eukprot:1142817-Pelagomonas_calceolata.AAC.1
MAIKGSFDTLVHKDSFKYLGMVFYRTLNMAKSAENASRAMLTSAYRIRRFVGEHALTYLVPAGMYASQAWGTGSLGVKRTTNNWAVLRGCVHQPLQHYWFRVSVKLYSSLLGTNSSTLRRVVQADLKLQSTLAVRSGGAVSMNDLSADLRYRLQGVWREAESVVTRGKHPVLCIATFFWLSFALALVLLPQISLQQTGFPRVLCLPTSCFSSILIVSPVFQLLFYLGGHAGQFLPQADQPNDLAEGYPPCQTLLNILVNMKQCMGILEINASNAESETSQQHIKCSEHASDLTTLKPFSTIYLVLLHQTSDRNKKLF